MKDTLPKAVPEFKKATEDGVLFRIYRLGSLEVRTIQEPRLPETLGAVFLTKAPVWNLQTEKSMSNVRTDEKIVGGRLYLEASAQPHQNSSGKRLSQCHYYVVVQTEQGN